MVAHFWETRDPKMLTNTVTRVSNVARQVNNISKEPLFKPLHFQHHPLSNPFCCSYFSIPDQLFYSGCICELSLPSFSNISKLNLRCLLRNALFATLVSIVVTCYNSVESMNKSVLAKRKS